ncbi:putative arb2 domain-containing protein [Rosellinia necatrix]|uniref:Putative arb2 domain-containing protein n=1 Tax=Rosellinia necatrix TaxID=77044 RepID=A0A1W2TGH9_ROSNE|nr:putative arb2 domain-containing protein [Rosellinia necatrix]
MFKRKWSALPADPEFPSDLKGLGYFINKDDEIRSIENEDNYFNFFISRNMRVCDRQRFAMNQAIQDEIHARLLDLGLRKLFLPASPGVASQPKLPIFASADIAPKSRVVLIFGETHQDLGVLAHRVLGRVGGIDKGSLVSVVRALGRKRCSPFDDAAPGIILANMGELLWWPRGGRTLSRSAFAWAPMRSAAHAGNYVDPTLNRVPGNETPAAHVKYIFENIVPMFVNPSAGLDVIALGDGAEVVQSYLNCDRVWELVGGRLNAFASVGGQFPYQDITCDGLRKFMRDRARAYVPSTEPLGLILAGPLGNPHTTTFTSLGCPVFSAGEPQHVETLFIACYPTVLDWLQEVADTLPENRPYRNAVFTVVYSDAVDGSNDWTDWTGDNGDDATGETENHEEDNASTGASAGELKIVTRDNVLEIGIIDGEEPTQKEVGEVEQIGGEQKQYVLRPKRRGSDGRDPEVGKD